VLDTARERSFDVLTALVQDVLQAPVCAISLIEENRQWFKAIAGPMAGETPREVAFCDHTIRARDCLVIEDATLDERFSANPMVTGPPFVRSYAGAPLTTPDGYNVGALCVLDFEPRRFGTRDLTRLAAFAEMVVDQLELRTLVSHDELTGASSRRALVEAAKGAIRHAARDGRPLSLISMDVDHFKSINDRFGHAIGDRVLKAVVEVCKKQLRPPDLLGRIGGEEFAVLLTDTNAAMAFQCAERLRQSISSLDLGRYGPVTTSFGVAAYRPNTTWEDWLRQADAALYAAKRRGRNCCVLAAEELSAAA